MRHAPWPLTDCFSVLPRLQDGLESNSRNMAGSGGKGGVMPQDMASGLYTQNVSIAKHAENA